MARRVQALSYAWVILCVAGLVTADATCPSNWIESPASGTCIKLVTDEKVTWDEARSACQAEDGDLVKILNKEMNDFLTDIYQPLEDVDYWIGLHYDNTLNYYVWLDETTEAEYIEWYPGQGETDNNQDCVVTSWYYNAWDEWGDYLCTETCKYICETNAQVTTTVTTTRATTTMTTTTMTTPRASAPAVVTTLKPAVTTSSVESLSLPSTIMSTESPTDDKSPETISLSEGLSGGAVAGIVIFVIVVVLLPLAYLGQRYYRQGQLIPFLKFKPGKGNEKVSFVNDEPSVAFDSI